MTEITPEQEEELHKKWLDEYQRVSVAGPVPIFSQKPYIISVVVVILVAFISSAAIVILSPAEKDTAGVIAVIFALSGAFIPGIFSLIKGQENQVLNKATYEMANHRLTQLLLTNSRADLAEGEKIGRESADARTDKIKEQQLAETGISE